MSINYKALNKINADLEGKKAKLLIVTKTRSQDDIFELIDSGYRGNLGAFVDNIHRSKGCDTSWTVEKHTRLFQICGPNLEPIEVEIVDSENDLGKTSRGTGGFGSTGI